MYRFVHKSLPRKTYIIEKIKLICSIDAFYCPSNRRNITRSNYISHKIEITSYYWNYRKIFSSWKTCFFIKDIIATFSETHKQLDSQYYMKEDCVNKKY